ncbi:twin-arginine translocation pathway signal [Mycobacterium sp. SMC-14]|uniref:twin-arginine translocation pathway signal n=1 Tax=Mycobacterium sp. SMC-14 TaxID=3385968 RepID=UPI00390CD4F7
MSESDEDDVTVETTEESVGDQPTADDETVDAALGGQGPVEDAAESAAPAVSTTRWIAAALAGLLVAAAALTCWLYFGVLGADRQLGPADEQAVMAAAADGAIAILTYAPKTMDQDFAAAENHLTGDFLSHYIDFTQKVVTPAVKEKQVQTVAAVVRKGVVSLHPSSAEVLIYLNQTTISKSIPDGSFSMSSVKVGLEKHDGRWLISSFDPV